MPLLATISGMVPGIAQWRDVGKLVGIDDARAVDAPALGSRDGTGVRSPLEGAGPFGCPTTKELGQRPGGAGGPRGAAT